MSSYLRTLLCVLIFFYILNSRSEGQCLVAPPAPACTGTETKASDGETIGTSTSRWYYGSPSTYANLTLNGGTLIICGNLTLSNFTFNSGTLYVLPGASLVIGGSTTLQLEGGCYFYNYGAVTIQRSFSLDNAHVSATQPNIFINASTSSVLSIPFDWFVINNAYSWFVNNGNASMHGIVTDPLSSAGSVCLGAGSQTAMSVLINNAPNAYTAPSGPGCVSVHDHSYICEGVTADASVRVCLSSSHATDSGCFTARGHVKAWGGATLFSSCAACGTIVVLPLFFLSFSAKTEGSGNQLHWQTGGDVSGYQVRIERSDDGIHFFAVPLPVTADAKAGSFSAFDDLPGAGSQFYRIVYSHSATEAGIVSSIAMIKRETAATLFVYPNPFTTEFSVRLPPGALSAGIELWGADGRKIRQLYVHNAGNGFLDIRTDERMAPGVYTLKATIGRKVYTGVLLKRPR